MRKLYASLALALLVAAPGAAFAATTTAPAMKPAASAMAAPASISGTVKAFDLSKHTLTLDNGIAYKLPADFKDPGLKDGAKVTVQWQMNGADYDATSVKLG